MLAMEEEVYTVADLAEKYKLAEETIRRYIRQEKLEAYQFGDTYRVTQTAWAKFLKPGKRTRKNKRWPTPALQFISSSTTR